MAEHTRQNVVFDPCGRKRTRLERRPETRAAPDFARILLEHKNRGHGRETVRRLLRHEGPFRLRRAAVHARVLRVLFGAARPRRAGRCPMPDVSRTVRRLQLSEEAFSPREVDRGRRRRAADRLDPLPPSPPARRPRRRDKLRSGALRAPLGAPSPPRRQRRVCDPQLPPNDPPARPPREAPRKAGRDPAADRAEEPPAGARPQPIPLGPPAVGAGLAPCADELEQRRVVVFRHARVFEERGVVGLAATRTTSPSLSRSAKTCRVFGSASVFLSLARERKFAAGSQADTSVITPPVATQRPVKNHLVEEAAESSTVSPVSAAFLNCTCTAELTAAVAVPALSYEPM